MIIALTYLLVVSFFPKMYVASHDVTVQLAVVHYIHRLLRETAGCGTSPIAEDCEVASFDR